MSLLFINGIFSGDVEVKLSAPGQINAGNEIRVEITLNKGSLNGFSRFQMELPNGLTAINEHSANADFSFTDQKVRLIWLRMPEDETVTFSFKILCNERLKGNFDLTGKFSYIDDNERKAVDIQSQSVAIVPNPGIDPGLIVDIRDFGKSIYQGNTSAGQVVCIRQKPEFRNNNEYVVSILVNKESLKNFAKIEEIIPTGYTAINIDSKGGVFNFRDGKAKYLWMNLPVDPYFVVSYKLIPINGQTNPAIAGTFSFMEDDKTKSVPITEKDVNLAALTPELVKGIILAQPTIMATTPVKVDVKPIDTGTKDIAQTDPTIQNKTTNEVKPNDTKQVVVVPDTKTVTNNTTQNTTQNTTNTNNTANTTNTTADNTETKVPLKQVEQTVTTTNTENFDLLEPQSGISFRVQIAAGHKPVNVKRYFRKYKLDNSIVKENHDGWIKYSIGSFSIYRDARDYRIHIWNTTPITDAFVSAYNEGKRITVQEALMVANQKWYK